MIGATQVEPWSKPGLPLKVLGWIGREDAPVLVRPNQILKLGSWGLRFLMACSARAFSESLAANAKLTTYSLAMFDQARRRAGIAGMEYALSRRGALKVFLTPESMATARMTAAALGQLGMAVRSVGRDELVALEPGLAPTIDQIVGGLHYPDEEIGDCARFCMLLEARCRELGVEFVYREPVCRLVTEGSRVRSVMTATNDIPGDAFVAALGSHTPAVLRSVGVWIPIVPVKGVTVTVPEAPWANAVRGAVMDHSRLFGLIRIGDRLRVSGLAELSGYDTSPSPARRDALLSSVLDLFPDFARCLESGDVSDWSGLRGNSPDGRPILGPTPVSNLFLNAGHGPQGWSTSCGAARLVADLATGRMPEIPWGPYGLDRFRLPWKPARFAGRQHANGPSSIVEER